MFSCFDIHVCLFNSKMKRFCFIGQVDTGKSTFAGHLVYKLGNISEHEFSKHQKECQGAEYAFWSRFLDIYEEERAKSKTHEFTILDVTHNGQVYQLVDTPGHKAFIRSLIEGISQFPGLIGCLLVSARAGEFASGWNDGQTREDIIIAKSVGIEDLVVLINKMDTCDWDQTVYDDIVKKIRPFINGCKFRSVVYMPASGCQGIGLVDREKLPKWYTGPCFMDVIAGVVVAESTGLEPIVEEKWTRFVANIKALKLNGIITMGYTCIMHYGGQEYEVTLDKIKGAKFIKENDAATIILNSVVPIVRGSNRRIILRDSTNTIGFGKIDKILK